MTGDRTYTEAMAEVGTQMAEMRGEFKTGLAELSGAVKTLTTTVEAGNAARMAESAELRKDVDDHELRLREAAADRARIRDENAEIRRELAEVRNLPRITPKGAWGVGATVAGIAVAVLALIF